MSDLLQDAISAKENGEFALAKQLISQALIQEPRNENAWMMMSDLVDDVRLRRNCLERVLAINPDNAAASTALTKLNTSPLSPVSRGERDVPISPPVIEKVPPFTPPFTWEGEPEQFLALGDLTYPELPAEPQEEPPDLSPTFDWANESEEPDKTIQKIFDAVSNPELASEPLPDTDLNWLENSSTEERYGTTFETEDQVAETYEEQPLEPAEEVLYEAAPVNPEDFEVSAEPQLGLDAFISTGEQSIESVTADYRLWDSPRAKSNRMVILSSKSLIFAQPKESDIPHIQGLFAENKMVRDMLGEHAGVVKLEAIQRVAAVPKKPGLSIDYKNGDEKKGKIKLTFSTPSDRDDFLDALQIRLGPFYNQSTSTFSLMDKVIPPLVTTLFIAFIGWGLIAGIPMLSQLPAAQIGNLHSVVNSLQNTVTSIGITRIYLVAIICSVVTLLWLLNNLRQPTRTIILER